MSILLFILSMLALIASCNKNSLKETADIDADNQKSFCETLDVEIFENGNEECPYVVKTGTIFKQIVFYSNYDSVLLRQESGLAVTIEEASLTENINSEKYLKIKATSPDEKNGDKENVWTITFSGYDSSLFDSNALIGRKWQLFLVEGFYGSVHADGIGRTLIVIKEGAGQIVAASALGVVNEDNENDWDRKIWPSKLVPDITSEVLHPENCASFQCREIRQAMYDVVYPDVLVAPPVKFNRNGKSVIVKNDGEEKKLDGYIYTISDNMKVHEKDPDQMIFDTGKKYQYNFQILNTEALK
ncbi:MAG TPA: hypothetical protein P5044_03905 [bacterium]|nr:hypothetical protein [bacterium]